jgi:hypothetical protein
MSHPEDDHGVAQLSSIINKMLQVSKMHTSYHLCYQLNRHAKQHLHNEAVGKD